MIRVTPTVIPIVLGLIISATTSYPVDGLGYAVGLMFADYHMFRRLSYMDPDTGFFNGRYLEVLKQEAESKDIKEAMIIRFRTFGDREKAGGDVQRQDKGNKDRK